MNSGETFRVVWKFLTRFLVQGACQAPHSRLAPRRRIEGSPPYEPLCNPLHPYRPSPLGTQEQDWLSARREMPVLPVSKNQPEGLRYGPLRFAIGFVTFVVLGVFAAPRPASAGVVYTFSTTASSGGETLTSSFSFEVPAIITGTGPTNITSLLSESDTGSFWTSPSCMSEPISVVQIDHPSGASNTLAGSVSEQSSSSCSVTSVLNAPFDTFGTFLSTDGSSTLTITQTSATPEPSSLLLLGTGLLGLGHSSAAGCASNAQAIILRNFLHGFGSGCGIERMVLGLKSFPMAAELPFC